MRRPAHEREEPGHHRWSAGSTLRYNHFCRVGAARHRQAVDPARRVTCGEVVITGEREVKGGREVKAEKVKEGWRGEERRGEEGGDDVSATALAASPKSNRTLSVMEVSGRRNTTPDPGPNPHRNRNFTAAQMALTHVNEEIPPAFDTATTARGNHQRCAPHRHWPCPWPWPCVEARTGQSCPVSVWSGIGVLHPLRLAASWLTACCTILVGAPLSNRAGAGRQREARQNRGN